MSEEKKAGKTIELSEEALNALENVMDNLFQSAMLPPGTKSVTSISGDFCFTVKHGHEFNFPVAMDELPMPATPENAAGDGEEVSN